MSKLSTWLTGSGLGSLLKNILAQSKFEDAALTYARKLGQLGMDALNNPNALRALFGNLINKPEVAVGAMVAGTEAATLVSPATIDAAKQELAKPHSEPVLPKKDEVWVRIQGKLNALVTPSPNLDTDGDPGPLTRDAIVAGFKQAGIDI